MKILLTGATGFIGHALGVRLFHAGHEIVVLSRDEKVRLPFAAAVFRWDAEKDTPPPDALQGVDVVMHLAGHPVAQGRWTETVKSRIRDSRIAGTRNLILGLKRMPKPPRALISASAVGFYGDRGDEILKESSSKGDGFLADVCDGWESVARNHGIDSMRWVALRIGVVLGREGGALKKMLPPFLMGVGGPLGSGKQWMSWIHLDDVVGLFMHALENGTVTGVLNAVAPDPVTNAQFGKTLGKALHRPAFLPAPAFAIRLAFGEMASILLGSQRVIPEKTLQTGYEFIHPELRGALKSLDLRHQNRGIPEVA